jgi:hypothetical protein
MNGSYATFAKLPEFKITEGFEAQFYNNLQQYNSTACSSYVVPNYKAINYDALTHQKTVTGKGHFNIIDAYQGKDADKCTEIGTTKN